MAPSLADSGMKAREREQTGKAVSYLGNENNDDRVLLLLLGEL